MLAQLLVSHVFLIFFLLLLSHIFICGYFNSPAECFLNWSPVFSPETSCVPSSILERIQIQVLTSVDGLRFYVQWQEPSAKDMTLKLAKHVFVSFQWSEALWFSPQKSLQNGRHVSKARNCYFSTKRSKLKLSSLK